MTPRSRRTALAASSLAGVALFLIVLAAGSAPPPRLPPVSPPAETPALPPLAPLQDFAAIAERPLFSSSRQPAPQRAAFTEAPPATLPPVTLVAVAISPDRREAVLKPAAGKSVTVSEGDVWQGWTVAGIGLDRVQFRLGADEKTLAFPKPARMPLKTGVPAAPKP